MKISLWIPAVVLYVVRVASSNSVQVGTVLFTTTDLVKKCWTESDKSLLKARLIMQDVLPDPDYIDFSNPDAVAVLLDYFHSCFQIISICTYGKIQNLMYLALSDAFGGYLRAYVLPFTKRAYYAGEVKYVEAKKLFQLYDDIRVFLKTNGIGWVEPQKLCLRNFHVKPLVITGGVLEACHELYIIEKEGKLHCINTNQNPKPGGKSKTGCKKKLRKRGRLVPTSKFFKHRNTRKTNERHKSEDFDFCNCSKDFNVSEPLLRNLAKGVCEIEATIGKNENETCQKEKEAATRSESGSSLKRVIVPLPVLDDCHQPHSIAVPFKKHPFRNLNSRDSAFILEYYYLTVVKCFVAKGNTRTDINNFNSHFRSWLLSQVVPHLCKEQWYPGFGGVLRILQTIKNFGVDAHVKDPPLNDIAFMFNDGVTFDIPDSSKEKGKNKVRDLAMNDSAGTSRRHVVTAVIIVSLLCLFIFCAFVFYYQATATGMCRSSRRPRSRSSSRTRFRIPEKQHVPKKKSECNVSFQFLVRFFKQAVNKKQNEERCRYTNTTCNVNEIVRKKKPPREEKECRFGTFVSPTFPVQQILASYKDPLKGENLSNGDGRHRVRDDEIKMLWKKPSELLGRRFAPKGHEGKARKQRYESTFSGTGSDFHGGTCSYSCSGCRKGSKESSYPTKPTSTCSSWECCAYDKHTTLSTTSRDNVSSATMEFFEEIIAKHKAMKNLPQYSTDQTETECSSSSLTDY